MCNEVNMPSNVQCLYECNKINDGAENILIQLAQSTVKCTFTAVSKALSDNNPKYNQIAEHDIFLNYKCTKNTKLISS